VTFTLNCVDLRWNCLQFAAEYAQCFVVEWASWGVWLFGQITNLPQAGRLCIVILHSEPRGIRASFANFCWQLLAECLRLY